MTEVFKQYTNTVRKLLQRYDKDLAKVFVDRNINENFDNHDNWNGGIDYYTINLRIPLEVYFKLKESNRVAESEERIASFYGEVMKGENTIEITRVDISPWADSQNDFAYADDDTVWRPGYFRLFISHVSKNKESATNLKSYLANYGIDCFVAHNDIAPTKEWEVEIEKGLFTMDALCAIVTGDFIKSEWCDQEVGIALGQHKLVIPINRGKNPYGFFGKFQSLPRNGKARIMAEEVWKVISDNEITKEIYSEKLVNLLLNAKNDNECECYLKTIDEYEDVDRRHIVYLHSHYAENSLLMSAKYLAIANKLFKGFGLTEISSQKDNTKQVFEDDSLPF